MDARGRKNTCICYSQLKKTLKSNILYTISRQLSHYVNMVLIMTIKQSEIFLTYFLQLQSQANMIYDELFGIFTFSFNENVKNTYIKNRR